jgi:transglutaminase-like putative cysteine protease
VFAPSGRIRLSTDCVIGDDGLADNMVVTAQQDSVEDLPKDALLFLLGSRYCETDRLSGMAWQLFGQTLSGFPRVQAICDYVHRHIEFNYQNARATRSAYETLNDRTGVCRDYAHLAIALCRSMNIPARYCTGYLSDVGTPPPYAVGDFAAWFEAWIGGAWHTFDPRNNVPRKGRVLMARGRDACDVAIATTFGPNVLESFRVWTDELPESEIGAMAGA